MFASKCFRLYLVWRSLQAIKINAKAFYDCGAPITEKYKWKRMTVEPGRFRCGSSLVDLIVKYKQFYVDHNRNCWLHTMPRKTWNLSVKCSNAEYNENEKNTVEIASYPALACISRGRNRFCIQV